MKHFTYKQNAFGRNAKGKDNPAILCKLIYATLLEPDKIVKCTLQWSAPILFETNAKTILEADDQFKSALGYSPAVHHIGTSIS